MRIWRSAVAEISILYLAIQTEVAAPPLGVAAPKKRRWLSPINQRRWQNFKANRRGFISLWVFLFLFVLSLCAELIANDKPLVIRLDGRTYFPIFVTYPETAFGGEFETAADYRDL